MCACVLTKKMFTIKILLLLLIKHSLLLSIFRYNSANVYKTKYIFFKVTTFRVLLHTSSGHELKNISKKESMESCHLYSCYPCMRSRSIKKVKPHMNCCGP